MFPTEVRTSLWAYYGARKGHDIDGLGPGEGIRDSDWFRYTTTSEALFSIGIRSVDGYLMASPEKALCDYLFTRKDLRIYSPKTLASYLEEDVRFDFDSFEHYDPTIFAQYAAVGYKADLFKAAERLFS